MRSMTVLTGYIVAALMFVLPALHAAPAASSPVLGWTPDIVAARAAFEKATGAPLRAGFRIEATVFPRYYALRNAAGQNAYFRDDMQWTANVRSVGWSTAGGRAPQPREFAQWQREQVRSIPLELLIPVKRRTPFVAVVWSAPDCPFCRRLEQFLEDEGVSVYVVPVGLSPDGFERAARAYCSENPGATWRDAFRVAGVTEAPVQAGERRGCTYPRESFVDIGFFLGRGRPATPIVVFADGSSIAGWGGERAPTRLKEVMAQKLYFPER